ncbi:MAG: hypothetical protein ACOCQT_00135 [Desulfovermiculus sp.]
MPLMIAEIMVKATKEEWPKKYKKDQEIFDRLSRWLGECKQDAGLPPEMSFYECGNWIEFTKSSGRKWHNSVTNMGNILADALKHTHLTMYLGALLYVMETTSELIPASRQRPWGYLTLAVAALYKRVDKDMAAKDQARAQELGEKLIDCME